MKAKSCGIKRKISKVPGNYKCRDFSQLNKRVNKLSNALYRSSALDNPIIAIERGTVKANDFEESKLTFLEHQEAKEDPVESLARMNHKLVKEGIQVVNLPKMPFGTHKTYNENSFVKNHFISDRSSSTSPEKAKELSDIIRIFRLQEKRTKVSRSKKYDNTPKTFHSFMNVETFDMKAGKLVVSKRNELLKSYENEKAKYDFVRDSQKPKGELNEKEKEKINELRKSLQEKQKKAVSRLHPPYQRAQTKLASELTSKFKPLFERNNKPLTRPTTVHASNIKY